MFFLGSLSVHRLVLAAVILLSVMFRSGSGQGLCLRSPPTLSTQVQQADFVLQVIWKDSHQEAAGKEGVTLYEITRIVKGLEGRMKVGDILKLPGYCAGTEGDTYLLTGNHAANIAWEIPRRVTGPAFAYAVYISSHRLSKEQRLLYFLNYLEHEDEQIADDAYNELANATHEELLKVRESIPTELVRRWIADEQTNPYRLGLYGIMLGVSGDRGDAAALLETINEPTQEFRMGLDGLMSGYLLISGSEGLKILETLKLKNNDSSFSDVYAALQALRFMWKFEPDRISRTRLRDSMRMLLDRPELADLVISDLARWEDWEVIDRLLEMYDDDDYSEPRIKRAIIRYLAACQHAAEQLPGDPPEYAVRASATLEEIQKADPKLYKTALRFVSFQ